MKNIDRTEGFTIIELMIATVIFSVVMLICLVSFLQIGRMFYKGVSLANTQSSARTIIGDLTEDVRFSGVLGGNNGVGATDRYFCLGDHRYVYSNAVKFGGNPVAGNYGFLRDVPGGCPPLSGAGSVAPSTATKMEELISPGMQINSYNLSSMISCVNAGGLASNSQRCNMHVHLLFYGADDTVFYSPANPADTPAIALTRDDALCNGGLGGSQYCAVSDLSTSVLSGF